MDVPPDGSPASPPTPHRASADPVPSVIDTIDRRIAEAGPQEAQAWLRVRRAVFAQDEDAKDRDHLRRVEILGIHAKIGLSAGAMLSGVALAFGGFGLPAFVCLGAGLYGLAPEFIRTVTRRVVGGKDGRHE